MIGGLLAVCLVVAVLLVVVYLADNNFLDNRTNKFKRHIEVLVAEGRRLGYLDGVAAGKHEALVMLAGDEEKSVNYRTQAARIAHVCPACQRMCIHCAREKTETRLAPDQAS